MPMGDLPRSARRFVVSILVVAVTTAIVSVAIAPPRLEQAPVALMLLVCATVAQQFKVKSPKHQSYYTTTIFFFAAALLLPPGYVIAIIVVAHAVELLRVRYRWYIQAFNVANFILCAIAAGAIFAAGESGHGAGDGRVVFFAV